MNDQVFFITSNQTKYDKSFEYSIPKGKLKKILSKSMNYRNELFTIQAFSFEITKEYLKYRDDIKEKKYSAKIKLNKLNNLRNQTFNGIILFKENRNNFIYDFEFNDCMSWMGNIPPPNHIRFTKCQQLEIYNEALNLLKVKCGDKLSLDLIRDSKLCLKGRKYDLDFYLEILKRCYSTIQVKTLLLMFNPKKIVLPEKLDPKKYSPILNIIEKKPDIIIRYVTRYDIKDTYYKLFYSLLLFFRANYEKEKVQSLINQKELRKYFVEIFPENYNFFSDLEVSDDLIYDMIKQENITFEKIKGALTFLKSLEKLLNIINIIIDLIFECCKEENGKIEMSEMANPKITDNINAVMDEIQKILNYEINNNITFITFNEEFWKKYINFNYKNNLKNLILIKKTLLLYKKTDISINIDNLELEEKINETRLELIKNDELKDEA